MQLTKTFKEFEVLLKIDRKNFTHTQVCYIYKVCM